MHKMQGPSLAMQEASIALHGRTAPANGLHIGQKSVAILLVD